MDMYAVTTPRQILKARPYPYRACVTSAEGREHHPSPDGSTRTRGDHGDERLLAGTMEACVGESGQNGEDEKRGHVCGRHGGCRGMVCVGDVLGVMVGCVFFYSAVVW